MASEITGDSPHSVAYRLTESIALLEGKSINDRTKGADRNYVITLYKECVNAVLDVPKWGAYS